MVIFAWNGNEHLAPDAEPAGVAVTFRRLSNDEKFEGRACLWGKLVHPKNFCFVRISARVDDIAARTADHRFSSSVWVARRRLSRSRVTVFCTMVNSSPSPVASVSGAPRSFSM